MTGLDQYLARVRQFAGTGLTNEAERELRAHVAEARAAYLAAGLPAEQAEQAALADLGRPEVVAAAFRRTDRARLRLAGGPAAWLALGHGPFLWVSLAASAWLVATRALPGVALDRLGERTYLLFLLLAVPVFAIACGGSMLHLATRHASGRGAALPLLVNVLALGAFLLAPVGGLLDTLDFHVHRGAREDVVRQIEAGALWSGSPSDQVAFVPASYARSVSDGGGQRAVTVYRSEGALHVVFFPPQGLGGPRSVFLYSASGAAPSLPEARLPQATRAERLDGHWFRLTLGG